jgi:thioredoxin reductase (NADPH)
LITPAEVVGFNGSCERITLLEIEVQWCRMKFETDYFIPLFGLTPKLGANCQLGIRN